MTSVVFVQLNTKDYYRTLVPANLLAHILMDGALDVEASEVLAHRIKRVFGIGDDDNPYVLATVEDYKDGRFGVDAGIGFSSQKEFNRFKLKHPEKIKYFIDE